MRTTDRQTPPRGSACAWLVAFGIAFGLVEAAAVVYLRALLGSAGDSLFPLVTDPPAAVVRALRVELLREAATLVLMLAPAMLFHPRPFLRFAAYLVVFGVWDLSYYAFLKALLDWPASLSTYDLLFLLPTVWVAPVLAPVLISLALVACGSATLWLARRGPVRAPSRMHFALALLGGALVLAAFMEDAGHFRAGGLPRAFDWPLFGAGYALALAAGLHFLYHLARDPRRRSR
jgi:hypothetical protein